MANPRSLPAIRTIGSPRILTLARHLLAGGTLDPAVSPTMGHILVATIGDSMAGKRYAASLYNALAELLPMATGVPGYLAHTAIEEGDTSGSDVGPVTRTDNLGDPVSAINDVTTGPCGPDLRIQPVSAGKWIQWVASPGRKKFKAAFLMGTTGAPTVELKVDTVSQETLDLSSGTPGDIGTLGYAGSAATTFRLEFTGGSGPGGFLGAALTDGADPNQLSVACLAHGGSRPVNSPTYGNGHTDVGKERWIPVWQALELPPMTLLDLHCGGRIVLDVLLDTQASVENLHLQDDIATPVQEFVEHYLDAGLTLMQLTEDSGDDGVRKATPPDIVYRTVHNFADLYTFEDDDGLDPGELIALADEFRTAMGDGALAAGPTGIGFLNSHAYLHTHPDDPFDFLTDDDRHYEEKGADVLARAVTREVYFHGLFDADRVARRRAGLVSFQLTSDQNLSASLAVMPLTSDVTVPGLDATLDTVSDPPTHEITVNEAATVQLHARGMAHKSSSGGAGGDPPEFHVERNTGSGFASFMRAEGTIAGASGSDYLLDASRVATVAAGHTFRLRARGATGQTLLAADTFLVIERVD